jgi:DNA polymerase gamma 1
LDKWHFVIDRQIVRPPAPGKSKVLSLLGKSNGLTMLQTGQIIANEKTLALSVASGDHSEKVSKRILRLAKDLSKSPAPSDDPWLKTARLDTSAAYADGFVRAEAFQAP